MQDFLAVLNGGQVVIGHNQSIQAGEHGTKLADFGPVLEAVVSDVKQAQAGADYSGGAHDTVLIKAQEQLLQTLRRHGKKRMKKNENHCSELWTFLKPLIIYGSICLTQVSLG